MRKREEERGGKRGKEGEKGKKGKKGKENERKKKGQKAVQEKRSLEEGVIVSSLLKGSNPQITLFEMWKT